MITLALLRRGPDVCNIIAYPILWDKRVGNTLHWGPGDPWDIAWNIELQDMDRAFRVMDSASFTQAEKDMRAGSRPDADILADLTAAIAIGAGRGLL